jgi:chromosome segregation ATPase
MGLEWIRSLRFRDDGARPTHASDGVTMQQQARKRLSGAAACSAAALLVLTACASEPVPREQLAVGKATVERAASAASVEAPEHLAAARDKLARAEIAKSKGDHTLARQLAEQAAADADLAEAQSRSARAERALAEVRASISQLRDEIARK